MSGVRWSGMSDEPRWTPSAEAQAEAYAAHLKAKAAQEAEVEAYRAARLAREAAAIEDAISERRWSERREAHA